MQPMTHPFVPKSPSRMTLSNVRSGRIERPIRALCYGVEGVGKSTFAAGAPSPVFLGADKGTMHLDIARLPEPSTWAEVLEIVGVLDREDHDYKTLVVDTLNWLEPMCWERVTGGTGSIEDVSGGFGKGYIAAVDQWRVFLHGVERLWERKGMHVVLLAHASVKSFSDPMGPNYDRFEIAMNGKAAGLFKQWVDFVLFAREETSTKVDANKKAKGRSTGARWIHTQWNAAYDAKSRGRIPPDIPLSWQYFHGAVKGEADRDRELLEQIEAGLRELGDAEVERKVRAYLENPRADVAVAANAVAAKLGERRTATNDGNEGATT